MKTDNSTDVTVGNGFDDLIVPATVKSRRTRSIVLAAMLAAAATTGVALSPSQALAAEEQDGANVPLESSSLTDAVQNDLDALSAGDFSIVNPATSVLDGDSVPVDAPASSEDKDSLPPYPLQLDDIDRTAAPGEVTDVSASEEMGSTQVPRMAMRQAVVMTEEPIVAGKQYFLERLGTSGESRYMCINNNQLVFVSKDSVSLLNRWSFEEVRTDGTNKVYSINSDGLHIVLGGSGYGKSEDFNCYIASYMTGNGHVVAFYNANGSGLLAANNGGISLVYPSGATYPHLPEDERYRWRIASVDTSTWTASFDSNGGSGKMSDQTFNFDVQSSLKQNSFTKTGYYFVGWNTQADGRGKAYKNTEAVRNLAENGGTVTLYAQWTANTCTVTFDGNGATSGTPATQVLTYGEKQGLAGSGISKTGYTFAGWSTSSNGKVEYATGDSMDSLITVSSKKLTLYAVWVANTYSVSFDSNDGLNGTSTQVFTYDAEQQVLNGNTFTRAGYTFTGWNTKPDGKGAKYVDKASVKNLATGGSVILYAQWAANTCDVTFDGNGSTSGSMDGQTLTYGRGQTLMSNAYVRTGYSFAGWSTSANGARAYNDGVSLDSLIADSSKAITLYAKWTANTYRIKFEADSGAGSMGDLGMTYGTAQALTTNKFTRAGYTFQGWATSANGTVAYRNGEDINNLTAVQNGVVTLYAVWQANSYAVVFDKNSGAGTMPKQTMAYDAAGQTLAANAFTRDGYHFTGWNTKADGTGDAYANGARVSNLAMSGEFKLFAQWAKNIYTVAFNGSGADGGQMLNQNISYDTETALATNAYTKSGYHFAGWALENGGEAVYDDAELVTSLVKDGTVTLYATWAANEYDIVFDANGGVGTTAKQTTAYDAETTLNNNSFTKIGYSFARWNTKAGGTGATYDAGAKVKNLAQTGALTLFAMWSANSYQIAFDPNSGTGTMAAQQMTYDASAPLAENGFARAGYTFAGWNTAADGRGYSYAAGTQVKNLAESGVVTLFAQWTENQVTVTYEAGEGGIVSRASETTGAATGSFTGAAATANRGYHFVGWELADSSKEIAQSDASAATLSGDTVKRTSQTDTVFAPLRFVACFAENAYDIAFNSNDGEGAIPAASISYADGGSIPSAASITKSGYRFSGWNTAADGSGASVSDGANVGTLIDSGVIPANGNSALTLYAVWEELPPVVEPEPEPESEPVLAPAPIMARMMVVEEPIVETEVVASEPVVTVVDVIAEVPAAIVTEVLTIPAVSETPIVTAAVESVSNVEITSEGFAGVADAIANMNAAEKAEVAGQVVSAVAAVTALAGFLGVGVSVVASVVAGLAGAVGAAGAASAADLAAELAVETSVSGGLFSRLRRRKVAEVETVVNNMKKEID